MGLGTIVKSTVFIDETALKDLVGKDALDRR
jgi:hypothetical protein